MIMLHIHWFRRDLRLTDNPGFLDAAQHSAGLVVPLFILDPAILAAPDTGSARVAFLLESLRALAAELRARRSRLIVRSGPSVPTLLEVVGETGAVGVTWNRDYTPFAQRRDAAARAALHAAGIATYEHTDAVIVEPETLRTATGSPYTVFTPYKRKWRSLVEQRTSTLLARKPLPTLQAPPETLVQQEIPTLADLGYTECAQIPLGGEQQGLAALGAFSQNGIATYAQGRDMLAQAATSRLSAYLRMGCVAPQAAVRAALEALSATESSTERTSIETWISELAWRDFYYQIMFKFPHVLRSAFRTQYDALAWENNPLWFQAWCRGQTGYPVIDAAMRQLATEAWMHNRARMLVASFLTKDLLIDWRWGARFFMQHLVDGDHASNTGGWQWAAGTGTDAQPYFRMFNPTSQAQKFDPHGQYVRRYVPELAAIPDRSIHTPWLLSAHEQVNYGVRIGVDYPTPIIDHALQRERALAMYRAVRL